MSETSESLKEFFTLDHRQIDDRWAEVESAAQAGAASSVTGRWVGFRDELLKQNNDPLEQISEPNEIK